MTLVLTEVSCYGVAMAADSAVTFGQSGRVYIGAQKLLPIPQLNAGLAVWGRGDISSIDADIWLQNYITNNIPSGISLWEMAEGLASELNNAFGRVIRERMGIHVGGFDVKDGTRGPAFYHIHNGHYHYEVHNNTLIEVTGEPIREFRAHCDHAPAVYTPNNFPPPTRNGDFAIFAFLFTSMVPVFRQIERVTGAQFPYPPSLASRGEYLCFWIKTIIEIYRLSNLRRRILPQPVTAGDASIGGPVTVLTISEIGIESFYTR